MNEWKVSDKWQAYVVLILLLKWKRMKSQQIYTYWEYKTNLSLEMQSESGYMTGCWTKKQFPESRVIE